MSDAKPFTADEVKRDNLWVPIMGDAFFVFCDRLRATVEALEKAEAERDEARALYRETEEKYAREVSAHDKTAQERDEARAEVARLQDLHTRCAAFDDQPGPSCVRLAADAARLREALVSVVNMAEFAALCDGGCQPGIDKHTSACREAKARAALKETP